MLVERLPFMGPEGTVPEPWWSGVAKEFAENVGHPEYPCHFGRAALERGELFGTFFNGDDMPTLADTLRSFLDMSRQHLRRRMVLAAFRRPESTPRTEYWYDAEFWRILQALHRADERAWPGELPVDPDEPGWEFAFHGTPIFVFCASPSYLQRRSRGLGPGMVLLFQPRNVFAGIEGGTPAGTRARELIRARTQAWDDELPHPDLGSYGDTPNREWRQYFIADDSSRLHERCPLDITDPAIRP